MISVTNSLSLEVVFSHLITKSVPIWKNNFGRIQHRLFLTSVIRDDRSKHSKLSHSAYDFKDNHGFHKEHLYRSYQNGYIIIFFVKCTAQLLYFLVIALGGENRKTWNILPMSSYQLCINVRWKLAAIDIYTTNGLPEKHLTGIWVVYYWVVNRERTSTVWLATWVLVMSGILEIYVRSDHVR